MNATTPQLDPFTLLKSPDGEILSFRHRVLSECGPGVSQEHSAQRIIELVRTSEYAVANGEKPSIRTCLECGCTEQFSCDGGCGWASVLLCSRCAGMHMRTRETIELEVEQVVDDCRVGNTAQERAVATLAKLQVELLLDIRDLLAAPVAMEETRLDILERIAQRNESRIIAAGALP